jgi:hypothetical protein
VGGENALKLQLTKRAYNYSASLLPIGVKALKPTGYMANERLHGRFRAFQGIYAIFSRLLTATFVRKAVSLISLATHNATSNAIANT